MMSKGVSSCDEHLGAVVHISTSQNKWSKCAWSCPSTSAQPAAHLQLLAKHLSPWQWWMFHVVRDCWRNRTEIHPVVLNPASRKLSAYKCNLCFSTWKEIALSAHSWMKTAMDTVSPAKCPCWEESVAFPDHWVHAFLALWGRNCIILHKSGCQTGLLKGNGEHGDSMWRLCWARYWEWIWKQGRRCEAGTGLLGQMLFFFSPFK